MDIQQLFDRFLVLSENKRKGYTESLGLPEPNATQQLEFVAGSPLPPLLTYIYNKVAGTPRQCKRENFIDFIPGFRLIHVNDWPAAYEALKKVHGADWLPLLRDDENGYYAINRTTDEVAITFLDEFAFIDAVSLNATNFLQMLVANYERKVYSVDRFGLLDYDERREGEVAREINPDVDYWMEE